MKKLFILIAVLLMTGQANASDEWLKSRPAATDAKIDYPAAVVANNEAVDRLLSQYPRGITLSYSSATTLVASTGGIVCSNSTGTVRKMRNNTATTNITFSNIDAGSEGASTTYYVYANCDADATTATFKISASSAAPTGVTYYRKIGSFLNDSSSNIDRSSILNDNEIGLDYYDSGWFAISSSTEYSKTHNLGTTRVIGIVYFSDSSDGSGIVTAFNGTQWREHNPESNVGLAISDLSTTVIEVQTGAQIQHVSAAAAADNAKFATSGYARIILIAVK